jgi:hypothetical protein
VLSDVNEFNSMAAHEYVPRIFEGQVTLFWASSDLRASFDLVAGWRVLAGGGIDMHEIAGSHLNLIKEPYVTELAMKLQACLEAAQRPSMITHQERAETSRSSRAADVNVRPKEEDLMKIPPAGSCE